TLRQAREKLRRHGLTSLFHAVFATSLFVQSLASVNQRLIFEVAELKALSSGKVTALGPKATI
ncbi:hypothetical protein QFZ86_000761, partial [Pseudomonas plecoglossicida]